MGDKDNKDIDNLYYGDDTELVSKLELDDLDFEGEVTFILENKLN